MVQKSGKLTSWYGKYPMIYDGFHICQVVVSDFWTINSTIKFGGLRAVISDIPSLIPQHPQNSNLEPEKLPPWFQGKNIKQEKTSVLGGSMVQ